MRTLFLLRGAPSSGKTTWVRENNLEPYTISVNDVRLLMRSPEYDTQGNLRIPQKDNREVWDIIRQAVEHRMSVGDLIILDAINLKTEDMSVYARMAEKYRYDVYVVDFCDIDENIVLERNTNRDGIGKAAPREIKAFYDRFEGYRIPGSYKHVTREEALDIINTPVVTDATRYESVNFFGDLHGCHSALMGALSQLGCKVEESIDETSPHQSKTHRSARLKDDELYVFCGDYVDRGIENAELLRFLIDVSEQDNVIMLEGNHERWLDDWAHDRDIRSKQFRTVTASELDASTISKHEASEFYKKLLPMSYLELPHEVKVFACHGGIPTFPKPFNGISTNALIKDIGRYDDVDDVEESWEENTGSVDGIYQVHGHRSQMTEMHPYEHVFNLEGGIEYGGDLRCVRFERGEDDAMSIRTLEIPNHVFYGANTTLDIDACTVEEAIESMRDTPIVKEKVLGNGMSVFRMTKNAHIPNAWNNLPIRADRLVVDESGEDARIVARSYDKFFDIDDAGRNDSEHVSKQCVYPVRAFVMEDGYLGMCSTDDEGNLLFSAKNQLNGPFVTFFKKTLLKSLGNKADEFAQFLFDEDATAVFESIDSECDKHVMQYDQSKVVLLDVIYNDLKFEHMAYDEICNLASDFKLAVKQDIIEINNSREFTSFHAEATAQGYTFGGRNIKGIVIEDADKSMWKFKTEYYQYWNDMRTVLQELTRKGKSRKHLAWTSVRSETEELYAWLAEYVENAPRDPRAPEPNIVDARREWEYERAR